MVGGGTHRNVVCIAVALGFITEAGSVYESLGGKAQHSKLEEGTRISELTQPNQICVW